MMQKSIRIAVEETGYLYNLKASPTVGTSYRFTEEVRKRWPGWQMPDLKRLQAGFASFELRR